MACYSSEEALQKILDSEEEFTFSSEEDCNSDDERLHFGQRIDPAEDSEQCSSVKTSRHPRSSQTMLNGATGPHAQQRNLYQHNSGKSVPPQKQSDTANIRLLVTFHQNRGLTTTCCPPAIITSESLTQLFHTAGTTDSLLANNINNHLTRTNSLQDDR
ncbi:hypothetical protein G5714_002573 [Onychostoma macrolepis]|uniref:Uncharacterized protein n=1 Tax=Onychostoma macrolepis TaxID=369639 RepID=A0A7J6D846_9TELE|nr:hypothetical protein G5714_002573 [Onychostoma macrolepis]